MESKEVFFYKFILPLVTILWVFFAPIFYWMGIIGFFIFSDLLLRLLICKRNGIEIRSDKLWRTVYKLSYSLTFLMIAYFSSIILETDIPFMKIIASYLILTELKSIDEKAVEITGSSLFKIVIDKFSIASKNAIKPKKK